MKKNKKHRNSATSDSSTIEYVRNIKEVHIVSNGIITICKATHTDDSITYYSWDSKTERDFVRKSVIPDAIIKVDKNVWKGWDYD